MRAELARLRCQLRIDPLTRLLNRAGLQECPLPQGVLLYLDLDGFKDVNDTLGHAAGDAALHAVGATLGAIAIAGGGAAARVGGDEFVLVLPMPRDELSLQRVVRTVRTSIELPVSIGAAPCSAAHALDRVLEQADHAMYADKQQRRARLPYQRGSTI